MKHIVYIALGTNQGDRLENLRNAVLHLAPALLVQKASPIYETPPWGYQDQPDFLNQVVRAQTKLPPHKLLVFLKNLEMQLGRKPAIPNGPRVIDLDLLFYDDIVLDTPTLTIPHPRMKGRGFVLLPMADLAPDLRHPVFDLSVQELLAEADLAGIRVYSL